MPGKLTKQPSEKMKAKANEKEQHRDFSASHPHWY